MKEFVNIIHSNASIMDALVLLNQSHSASMTLFVTDNDGKMIGTLTDGDIRRALIQGNHINDNVCNAIHRDFHYLTSPNDIEGLRDLRGKNISFVPILDADNHISDIIDLTVSKSHLPVDAVLMAGGKGERLRPLTLDTPKPLLKIGEKPIIDHNVDSLHSYGIKNIYATVNYLKEKIIQHFKTPTESGAYVQCIEESNFYGTIGALRLIDHFDNDTILVMNSDLLTNIDYEDFYLHFMQNDAIMSAAAIPYTISVPYGIFRLDGREILGVEEKPVYNLYANAGIYLLKRKALQYIPKDGVFNATDLIDILAAKGEKVVRYPLSGLWIDIGTPDEYAKACELARHLS